MAVEAKSIVDSLREIVQDILVPELKAVKVSVDSLRNETKLSLDSLRIEMKLRDDLHSQSMANLSSKLDFAIDIRERLATLEARMPRQ